MSCLFLSLTTYLSNIMVCTTQTLSQIKSQEITGHIKKSSYMSPMSFKMLYQKLGAPRPLTPKHTIWWTTTRSINTLIRFGWSWMLHHLGCVGVCVCICVHVCVCACVRACVCACVLACVWVYICTHTHIVLFFNTQQNTFINLYTNVWKSQLITDREAQGRNTQLMHSQCEINLCQSTTAGFTHANISHTDINIKVLNLSLK